jgi:hypothetical protein
MSDKKETDLIDYLLKLARRGWIQATALATAWQEHNNGRGGHAVRLGHEALGEIEQLQAIKKELAAAGADLEEQKRGLLRQMRS